jgi:proteasome inhibitor subunit 1 (PI31)
MSGLSGDEVLKLAGKLLPSSETILKSPIEALGLLIHAIQTSTGFKLVGGPSSSSSISSENVEGEGSEAVVNKLDANWNLSGGGSISFCYRHEQSSLQFEVKVVEIGGRAMVIGLAVQVSSTSSFEIEIFEFEINFIDSITSG